MNSQPLVKPPALTALRESTRAVLFAPPDQPASCTLCCRLSATFPERNLLTSSGSKCRKDLSAYNVYRHEENAQPARIGSVPGNRLSFQDIDVLAGHKYFYCISAVDVRGNEGAKPPTATVVVP
jgi:fibronectin type 3 domain-containing protein